MSYPVRDLRGERRPAPGLLRGSLSAIYSGAVRVHHGLYDRGILRAHHAALPVISVGALTAGGAGKTPVTRWLAQGLRARGFPPAILSRGYASRGGVAPRVVEERAPDARRDGDEPALLARSLPGVPVVVGPDRAASALVARRLGAGVLVLDDGMQHRRLHREADICLWDRATERSHGRVLPAGPLREPLSGVGRADFVLLVERHDGAPHPPRGGPDPSRIFRARLRPHARQTLPPHVSAHALSGIADPVSFERSLVGLGLRVTGATRHADHHPFSAAEVEDAARRAAEEGADVLAVTAKDHVRWPHSPTGSLPVPAVFDLDVTVESEDGFFGALTALLGERSP